MDIGYLIGILALGTIGAVLVFSIWSKWRTEQKLDDDNAEKSRLAKDAPNH